MLASASFVLLLGLAAMPAAELAVADATATRVLALEGADAAAFTAEPVVSSNPPAARDGARDRPPRGREALEKAAKRPKNFWWTSIEEVLDEGLYGACGVRDCCRLCSVGKACGDTCINPNFSCRVGCGCACQLRLGLGD